MSESDALDRLARTNLVKNSTDQNENPEERKETLQVGLTKHWWTRFWDRQCEVLYAVFVLRAAVIVVLLYAGLILLPSQTAECLRVLVAEGDVRALIWNNIWLWGSVFGLGMAICIVSEQWVGRYQRNPPKPFAIYSSLGGAGAAVIVATTASVLVQIKDQRIETKLVSWVFLVLASLIGIGLIVRALLPSAQDERDRELGGAMAMLPGELRSATWNAAVNIFAWVGLFYIADSRVPFVLIFWSMAILSFAGWLAFMSVATRIPLLALLFIWFIFLSWLDWNDHHIIRYMRDTSESAKLVSEDFKQWLQRRPRPKPTNGRYSVFLVAAEGGGIRAAVMTAMVLDELRFRCENFVDHLYAIVGVSGGSVGAASFVAAVRDGLPALSSCEAVSAAKTSSGRVNWQLCLQKDLLGPTIKAMLGGDFISQFVPTGMVDLSEWDRARALERAWSTAYKEATGRSLESVWFKHLQDGSIRLPQLLLMSTSANTGRPVAISNVSFPPGSPIDTLGRIAPGIDVPLVTAAIMSARFPAITPAARLPVEQNGHPIRLLDGGYFENSGVTTTLEILKEIGTPDLWDKVRFVVIRIQNGARGADSAGSLSMGFSEIKSPVWGLYQTGSARAEQAVRTLQEKVASARSNITPEREVGGSFVELKQSRSNKYEVNSGAQTTGWLDLVEVDFALRTQDQQAALPLGWMLSTKARNEIARQLHSEANNRAFREIADLLARE